MERNQLQMANLLCQWIHTEETPVPWLLALWMWFVIFFIQTVTSSYIYIQPYVMKIQYVSSYLIFRFQLYLHTDKNNIYCHCPLTGLCMNLCNYTGYLRKSHSNLLHFK